MGAWIEILTDSMIDLGSFVAPHMGAWIEIYIYQPQYLPRTVAPHMGAWIEINNVLSALNERKRRTPHGCVD